MGILSQLNTQWLVMYRQAQADNDAFDAARRQKIINTFIDPDWRKGRTISGDMM